MRSGPFLILFLAGIFVMSTCAAYADKYSEELKMLRSSAVEAHVRGDLPAALRSYEQALVTAKSAYGENSPFLAEIYYDMGTMCLSFSDFDKAETYLRETVRLSPNSTSARLRLAELLRLRSRPEEAAKQASIVLSKHRDDMVAHQELALAFEANQDNIRAYKEYTALEQLVQHERDLSEGKFVPVKFTMPFFNKPAVTAPDASAQKAAQEAAKKNEQDKKAAEAKKKEDSKKADLEAKKASDEAKKKADLDKKKADQDKKKSAQDKKKSDDKKKADQEKKAADARNKAEQAAKKNNIKPASDDPALSGLPANLRSKAVLLTPVGKKKPAVSESTTTTTVPVPKKAAPPKAAPDEEDTSGGEDETEAKAAPPPKKAKPVEAKAVPQALKAMTPKADTSKPKAGKHAAGLVPPPPPLVPTYPVMAPPPPVAVPIKPKPIPPKKVEEKPKEQPAASNEKPEDEDWLLDFAGTKAKKKK